MLRKIFTLLAAVLLIAIIINGLFSFQIIKTYGNQVNYEYLKAAAIQATRQLESGISAKDVSVESDATFQRENRPVRLTLIDRTGQVLDNHLQRPEVAAALTEAQIGSSIRFSNTLNAETLYLARYSEKLKLIVRTSMPIRSYQAGLIRIVWMIAIIFVSAVIILILMGFSFLRSIIQPLQQLESATSAMAAGDYSIKCSKMIRKWLFWPVRSI
jgi:two-component system phosphate regulon sensor histidine kinase PhoR